MTKVVPTTVDDDLPTNFSESVLIGGKEEEETEGWSVLIGGKEEEETEGWSVLIGGKKKEKAEGGVQELLDQLQQNPDMKKTSVSSSTSTSTCQHPAIVVNGVCIDCRRKIENKDTYGLGFSYLHKGLMLSEKEIKRLRALESKKQLAQKKLHLVLDIDNTLLQSFGPEKALELGLSSLVKLRPLVFEFLERASTMFQMYIYTLGSRLYAENMAKILDPQGIYFDNRIISRDDNPKKSIKFKTLDLVLGEESNVLILDDNSQVWKNHKSNLILMKEFVFTGKNTDETEMNTPLNEINKVLHTIHWAFFHEQIQRELRCQDVRELAASLRSTVLEGCNLYMKNFKDSDESWKMAEELGAKCCKELNSSVTHLVKCKKGTTEYVWAVRHKKYSVHSAWIEEAYYLWQRPPEEGFDITKWIT